MGEGATNIQGVDFESVIFHQPFKEKYSTLNLAKKLEYSKVKVSKISLKFGCFKAKKKTVSSQHPVERYANTE